MGSHGAAGALASGSLLSESPLLFLCLGPVTWKREVRQTLNQNRTDIKFLKFPRSEDASAEGSLENKHLDHVCLWVMDVYSESDSLQWTLKAKGRGVSLETSCVHNPDTC